MIIQGTYNLARPPAQVYQALNDPAILQQTIPGCEKLEAIAPVDVGATAFEIAIVIGLLIFVRRPRGNHSSPRPNGRRLAILIGLVVAVAAVTTFVIAMDKPAASSQSSLRDVSADNGASEAAQLPRPGGMGGP